MGWNIWKDSSQISKGFLRGMGVVTLGFNIKFENSVSNQLYVMEYSFLYIWTDKKIGLDSFFSLYINLSRLFTAKAIHVDEQK